MTYAPVPHRLSMRLLQLLQLALFLSLPQLLQPHWESIVTFWGGPKYANVYGVVCLHVLVLLIANTFFYTLYSLRVPAVEQYKVHPGDWPWVPASRPGATEAEKAKAADFAALVRNSILLNVFNVALTIPLALVNYETSLKFGYSASSKDYPATLTVAWQLLAFMLIEDTMFYWTHRSLHHKAVYPYIHKVHHRFTHSVSIAAEATHPIEFVVGNVLPFATGPLLLGAHCVTLYMWTLWRIGETVTNHSGYDLPWSAYELLPFQGTALAHDAHHSINTGNYSSLFQWWDVLCGTDIPMDKAAKGLLEHEGARGKARKAGSTKLERELAHAAGNCAG